MTITQQRSASEKGRRHWLKVLGGLSIMLTACGSAEAPGTAKNSQGTAVAARRYAVAGIALGMTSTEAAAMAARAGYILTSERKGDDWQAALNRSVNGSTLDFNATELGIREHRFRRGGELLSVHYLAMPSGSVARLISYSAPAGVLDFSRAAEELTKRYGTRSFANPAGAPWAMWCAREATSSRGCLAYPHLSLSQNNAGVSISASDPLLQAEQNRLFRARSGARPSF